MNVFLLYPDHEWKEGRTYFDKQCILRELNIKTLLEMTSGKKQSESGLMQSVFEDDIFLEKTMEKIMMEPLETKQDIKFRQEIIKDCIANGAFIQELYKFAFDTMEDWKRLGRRVANSNNRDTGANLVSEIYVLRLFVERLSQLKTLVEKEEFEFHSEGLRKFVNRLQMDFSEPLETNLSKLLDDIAFYIDTAQNETERTNKDKRFLNKSKIIMKCDIRQGLKFDHWEMVEIQTVKKKMKSKLVGRLLDTVAPEVPDDNIVGEIKQMEYQAVRYIMSYCDGFVARCKDFFEQLLFQTAFYMGAYRISEKLSEREIAYCYPIVADKNRLCFEELKDIVMAVEQDVNPVGNSSDIMDKSLLIITGANQGGKSTFLRSIGVAQVMMQCGLFVGAKQYESEIYTSIFTHFTRREDSEMNSGRLDEELGRMSTIIDYLDEKSLVLLNESFATTTEQEGSVIAYDIISALKKAGVKVLMVTHLLSFAKKIYDKPHEDVEFLSAERLEDGRRTFKMIQHEPELTSFGLDLYDEIIAES